MKQRVTWVAGALLFVSTVGCQDYDNIDLSLESSPPLAATITSDLVQIPAGVAVRVLASPRADPDNEDGEILVDLISRDPAVLGVDPGLRRGEYIFYGVAAGSTSILLRIDDDEKDDIPATVLTQGDAP